MPRKKAHKKRPEISSIFLSPQAKKQLDRVCDSRGMNIKHLLGGLIGWFIELDATEQSVVLGQMEHEEIFNLSTLLLRRKKPQRKRA